MTTTIYLIRHGEYENPRQVFHGRLPGFPLSAEGRSNAQKTATLLAGRPITTIYASPLERTAETAMIIASPHGLTIVTDDRLMDVDSVLQGEPLSYVAEKLKWNLYHPKVLAKGGEKLGEVFARINRFIKEKAKKHENQEIVIVTHGDLIMSTKVKYQGGRLSRRTTSAEYVEPAHGFVIIFEKGQQPVLTKLSE